MLKKNSGNFGFGAVDSSYPAPLTFPKELA
jgi:hypothetical protein